MLTTDGPSPQDLAAKSSAISTFHCRMIWKRKLSAGILAGAIGLIGCFVVHRLPAIYASEALILVDSQKIPKNSWLDREHRPARPHSNN